MQNGGQTCGAPHAPWKDNLGLKLSSCVLTTALKLAREQRWVAEWLFPTADTAKHPPLPPEAFEHSLAIEMNQSMMAPQYNQFPCSPKQFEESEQKLIMRKDVNMLIVPVVAVAKVTAGYTFCSGHSYSRLTGFQPVTHTAGSHIMSRFIYDMSKRQFLAVSPMLSEGVYGIIQMIFHCDGSCERNFITVPFLHYSADSLPTVVMTSQCNLETRDLNSSPAAFQFEDNPEPKFDTVLPNINAQMDSLLDELTSMQRPFSPTDNIPLDFGAGDPTFDPFMDSISPISSTQIPVAASTPASAPPRWLFSEYGSADGSTDDGVGIPRKPGNAPTSSGVFDMSALTRSLAKLERNVKGSFFCLRAKRDIIDPITGELLNRQTGRQVSMCATLGALESSKLRQIAAQTYYASVLAPTVDARLVSRSVTAAAEQFMLPSDITASFLDPLLTNGDMSPILSTANSALSLPKSSTSHMLAPRPLQAAEKRPTPAAPAAVSGPIDKAEAKKIRNRLSAAKSNQRRRQQLEAQKRELIVLQQRVIDLKKKREGVMAENERLRAQFFNSSAIGELS